MNKEDDRAGRLVREAAEAEAQRFTEGFEMMRDRCESPIEELFLAALYADHTLSPTPIHFMASAELPANPYFDQAVFVFAQVPFGAYRVDFAILDASLPTSMGKPRLLVVECDGHDFHERTKEQARRDKQRDRFLVSKGCRVLRFTGSEIWADPEKCADEVIDHLAANEGSIG